MIKNAISGFAVNDLEKARGFYSQTIGLTVTAHENLLQLHTPGGAVIFMYPKPEHIPASFTILNFMVDNIETEVSRLKNEGVFFDHYDDGQHQTDANGIFRGQPPLIAWFKDPFGNILSLIQIQ
jgi:catechol 2,3-dioxygenase-like lactoylglutathione lyase family enzyme